MSPICIHCATPVESLYLRYGKDHVVLAPCNSPICRPNLNNSDADSDAEWNQESDSSAPPVSHHQHVPVVLADEYLEHDLTIVIIDLILAKPRAYRHLLFNRMTLLNTNADTKVETTKFGSAELGPSDLTRGDEATPQPSSDPSKQASTPQSHSTGRNVSDLIKKFLALGLVDSYIRWFYLCVQPPTLIFSVDQGIRGSRSGGNSNMENSFQSRFLPGEIASLLQVTGGWSGALPVLFQSVMFFPSYTPQYQISIANSNSSASLASQSHRFVLADAMCKLNPLPSILPSFWTTDKQNPAQDLVLPTLTSYLNLVVVTLLENLALHVTACIVTFGVVNWMYTPRKSRPTDADAGGQGPETKSKQLKEHETTKKDPGNTNIQNKLSSPTKAMTYDPLLPSKAILLSQLSPLILLCFVLLWNSAFPHAQQQQQHSQHQGKGSQTNSSATIVWLIRTFLSNLNAGIAISTVLPSYLHHQFAPSVTHDRRSSRAKVFLCTLAILVSAWAAQSTLSYALYTHLAKS